MKRSKSYKYYYLAFKESPYYLHTIYAGVAVVACLLGIFVVFPLITRLIDINQQVAATQQKIDTLHKNLSYLNSLDNYKLRNDSDTAKAAVPLEKDYTGTIQAIMASAVRANIDLSDFGLTVGSLKKVPDTAGQDVAAFGLNISITGDLPTISKFITELQQKVPLLNVSNVSYQNKVSSINVEVAVAPYAAQTPDLSQTELSISSDNERLLNKLSDWKNNSVVFTPVATQGANLPPF